MTKKKYKHSVNFEDYLIEKLQDPEMTREYLNVCLEEYVKDNDFTEFMRSLELVIKARQSLKSFSEEINLNRANLYAIFRGKRKPQFGTVLKILTKLGYTLKVA
ncbi:MAG: helix-turn-helix domain-containing protein [Candidatus Gastranaerophilales bacterium]|nr:helix-turn-helix domain-containing protein [Candidatus Gastranaerophilales bacterium]